MHQHILELPGILLAELFANQIISLILKGVPISVVPSHRTNVLLLDIQAAPVVHLIRLDQAGLRVLQGPNHPSNYC